MKEIIPKLERNLKIVTLENLDVKPGDSFGFKLNVPGICLYGLRLNIPGFTKNHIKTGWKNSRISLENFLRSIFVTEASQYAYAGNLEKLNPFMKPLAEINQVEISFNNLHMLTKSDTEFTGAFLSEEIFSAMVAKLGNSTRVLRTLLCGKEETKLTTVMLINRIICNIPIKYYNEKVELTNIEHM